MARPGAVAEVEVEEEVEDGAQDEGNQGDQEDGSIKKEVPDTDEGGENQDTGKDDGEADENLGEDEAEAEVDPRDAKLAALEKEIAEIKAGKPAANPEPAAPAARTEEQWNQITEETGLSRKAVEHFESGLMQLGRVLVQHFNGQFAGSAKEKLIETMSASKEYGDIKQYRTDIDDFLKMFDPTLHSRQDLLEKAYAYAKGKNSGKVVKKIMNTTERNRRIAGPARPSSPGGKSIGGDKGGKPYKLSPTERAIYQKFGKNTFKTEEEYAASLARKKGR